MKHTISVTSPIALLSNLRMFLKFHLTTLVSLQEKGQLLHLNVGSDRNRYSDNLYSSPDTFAFQSSFKDGYWPVPYHYRKASSPFQVTLHAKRRKLMLQNINWRIRS